MVAHRFQCRAGHRARATVEATARRRWPCTSEGVIVMIIIVSIITNIINIIMIICAEQ